ncbi:hypothetical protein HMPREF1992_00412 [Selenomonas sp. oral taxon 892 str. F0426]|nr:hypothetical protein HMPREF1992_00412 [Selenomonas sp. oral taxon 892 str. F0426]
MEDVIFKVPVSLFLRILPPQKKGETVDHGIVASPSQQEK